MERPGTVVVVGATGRQGGAAARSLLADGWPVRAVTRDASSVAAVGLAELGAEVVEADLMDPAAADRALAEAYGVFNVQNPQLDGIAAELTQGRHVFDAAARAGVAHVVYGGAGPGREIGVEQWDSKVELTAYARSLGLPLTVLRPMAFLELMTDQAFYPPVSVWHLMPKLMGDQRPVPWIATRDLGRVVAAVLADPEQYVGRDLPLAADVRTIAECRETWRAVHGKAPKRFPMPEWLFKRVADPDLLRMWRWLADGEIESDTTLVRRLVPDALTVDAYLREHAGA